MPLRECCTKDEMLGAEGEGAGSVLTYVTEPESRKQRSRSPSCNSLQRGNPISTTNKVKRSGNWHCDGYFLVHLWNVKFKYQ